MFWGHRVNRQVQDLLFAFCQELMITSTLKSYYRKVTGLQCLLVILDAIYSMRRAAAVVDSSTLSMMIAATQKCACNINKRVIHHAHLRLLPIWHLYQLWGLVLGPGPKSWLYDFMEFFIGLPSRWGRKLIGDPQGLNRDYLLPWFLDRLLDVQGRWVLHQAKYSLHHEQGDATLCGSLWQDCATQGGVAYTPIVTIGKKRLSQCTMWLQDSKKRLLSEGRLQQKMSMQ